MSGSSTQAKGRGPSVGAVAEFSAGPDPAAPFTKLRPRRNASPEAVATNQQARLRLAMVEACAGRGLAATSVRDVVSLAGVSNKTLYKHFGDKKGCFLATYDAVIEDAVGRISAAYREEPGDQRDWAGGLCRAFDAFAAELVERPASSRLALVEIFAAGPEALPRIDQAEAVFVTIIRQSLDQAPDGLNVSSALIRPLVGGVWFVSRSRLLAGRAEEFARCGAELGFWLLSYRTAASLPPLDASTTPAHPVAYPGRRRGGVEDERTRILRAAASLIARGGFADFSDLRLAESAEVDVAAVAAEFASPSACFLATLELLSAEALARALRESREGADWPGEVCRAVRALCLQITEDRALARAAFVEVFGVGPAGTERRVALMHGFAAMLVRRAPADRRPSPLVAEAIVGSIWSLLRREVLGGRTRRLPSLWPSAAFIALAPILGAEEALEAIGAELSGPDGRAARSPRAPTATV